MNSIVELAATLPDGQSQVLVSLHGVICDCGGWVLNRGLTQPGLVRFLFEFPRDVCVEIYSALVSFGLDLTPHSHRVLAELCRCTPYLFDLPSRTIRAVDAPSLEASTEYLCSLEIVKVELYVQFAAQQTLEGGSADVA
jgi:hypothetical protein